MTISSSLNAGIMGLSVNSTKLGTISDNIANSDTYGYKRAVVDFQSMVIKNTRNSYSAGGVRVTPARDVDEQGALISTGSSMDIAVAGRGLLPVTDLSGTTAEDGARELMLTATGSFSPDEDGYYRTPGGLVLLGWPTDPNGEIGAVTRQGGGGLEPVRIADTLLEANPTRNIQLGVNLPADATTPGTTPEPYEISVEYYDNLGRTQLLSASFTPQPGTTTASNSWSVELFDNSTGSPVSVSTFDVSFQDTQGQGGLIDQVTNNGTYDPATGNLTVTLPSGDVNLFVGKSGEPTGMTQFAADFAPVSLTKDGTSIGILQGVEIDGFGKVQVVFDTGVRRTVYQIPVADVANPNGLIAVNNQAFRVSQNSGEMYLWDAGTGPVGETVGYSLMESTTDIASELTALIETQRAYSSNAKIIQIVDEMLQETNNIIR